MSIRIFLDLLKSAVLVRTYLAIIAMIIVCLLVAFTVVLFAPIHEYAKYVILFVIIILAILVWRTFLSRTSKLPPVASEDSLLQLLQYGITYGSDGNLMRIEDVGSLESGRNPVLLPSLKEEIAEEEMDAK